MKKETMKRIVKTSLVVGLTISTTFVQAVHTDVEAKGFKGFENWISNIFNPGRNNVKLSLVEDETTVKNGDMLRASTYNASTRAQGTLNNVKFFNATMFNYDMTKINNETHKLDYEQSPNAKYWEGMYFGDFTQHANEKEYGASNTWELDQKAIQNNAEGIIGVGNYLLAKKDKKIIAVSRPSELTTEKLNELGVIQWEREDKALKVKNSVYYLNLDTKTGVSLGKNKQNLQIENQSISYNTSSWFPQTYYLVVHEGNVTLKPINYSGISYYKKKSVNKNFALWNYWTGHVSKKNIVGDQVIDSKYTQNGNSIYSGLVKPTLEKDNIKFTKNEPGIFTLDPVNGKDVYENVGLPFEYNASDMSYEFDSSKNGAYFKYDVNQPKTSDVPKNDSHLYFDKGNPQPLSGGLADGSKDGWFPYNKNTSNESKDYLFGSMISIPFKITPNGKIQTNKGEQPIKFEFSGDDDVWVFIDGKLVLDMGGIHNRINGMIDFSANNYNVTVSNNAGSTIADCNTSNQGRNVLNGKVFNENNNIGALDTDRNTFASQDEHTLMVYYLERGEGASNCKIKFNLPVNDDLIVTKRIDSSKDSSGNTSPLTKAEQDSVNQTDFKFILMKKENGTQQFAPVKNRSYIVYDAQNQYLETKNTNSEGVFTIKNRQSAKFITQMKDNDQYYVKELLDTKAFVNPDWKYEFKSVDNNTITKEYEQAKPNSNNVFVSDPITVSGTSLECHDEMKFIFKNYLNKDLPNPSAVPGDDVIVVDYGLKVRLPDLLVNDIWRGDSIELTSVDSYNCKFGKIQSDEDGYYYQLDKPLTDVETVQYTVKVTGGSQSKTEKGKLYIVPATTMYYEEDFGNMVTYFGPEQDRAEWKQNGSSKSLFQEIGLMGDKTDSPYGSDQEYIDSTQDSAGSYQHVDTTTKSAAFRYKFTGTGTAIFARTSKNSGYMKITVDNECNERIMTQYRDTKYVNGKDNDTTVLYNVPVYTLKDLDYGTYTVTVYISGSKDGKFGDSFDLDGIRVYNPFSSTDENLKKIADTAYAADGEDGACIVTVRDKLINQYMGPNENNNIDWKNPESKFISFTDSNGSIVDAEDFCKNAPKDEVYLDSRQKISFSLKNWDPNYNLYLGIKACEGNGNVKINGKELPINNTVDCFYNLKDYIKIDPKTNIATITVEQVGGNIISITNIKTTGNAEFAIIENQDIEVQANNQ